MSTDDDILYGDWLTQNHCHSPPSISLPLLNSRRLDRFRFCRFTTMERSEFCFIAGSFYLMWHRCIESWVGELLEKCYTGLSHVTRVTIMLQYHLVTLHWGGHRGWLSSVSIHSLSRIWVSSWSKRRVKLLIKTLMCKLWKFSFK